MTNSPISPAYIVPGESRKLGPVAAMLAKRARGGTRVAIHGPISNRYSDGSRFYCHNRNETYRRTGELAAPLGTAERAGGLDIYARRRS